MRSQRLLLAFALVLPFAGCAGVSPRPESLPLDDLPLVELDDAARAVRDAAVETAVVDVVRRRYDSAAVAADRALALDPRSARARSVRGMVLLQRALLVEPPDLFALQEGEVETLTAERLAPTDPFVGWMRAVFLAEAGHVSAAAAAAEAALLRVAAAPGTERAALLGVAGTYRYELGEDRAALPHLRAYVALRPDDATANFRLGSCLLRVASLVVGPREQALQQAQRDAEDAARAFARAYALAPGDEDAALAAGKALQRASELAQRRGDSAARDDLATRAGARFAEVAAKFPSSPEPWFCTGCAEEARGRDGEAQAAYQQALVRDAQHVPSLLNLASLQERSGAGPAEVLPLLHRLLRADDERRALRDGERRRVETRVGELEGRGAAAAGSLRHP